MAPALVVVGYEYLEHTRKMLLVPNEPVKKSTVHLHFTPNLHLVAQPGTLVRPD